MSTHNRHQKGVYMNIDIIKKSDTYEIRRTTGELLDEFEYPDPKWVAENVQKLTKLRIEAYNSILKRKFIPLFDTQNSIWVIGVLGEDYNPTRYKVRSFDHFKSLIAVIKDLKKLNKNTNPIYCKRCNSVFFLSPAECKFFVDRNLDVPKTCFACRGVENYSMPRTLVDYFEADHDGYIQFEELNDSISVGEFLPIFAEEEYTTKINK